MCPCGSGLDYAQCCGVPDRRAINSDIMASIASDGSIARGALTAQMQRALQSIGTSPDLFPARIRFADDKAYFVKMSPRWYSESVFLDPARIKGTYVIESNLRWTQTIAGEIAFHPSCFIFHTAFCGSTLMAQALDSIFDCLPLREPEVLGNVLFHLRSNRGDARDNTPWLEGAIRLLSRSYRPEQYVVIKANDNANPLMADLLAWRADLPVLFMYTPLGEFLAGCLKADNRRAWIHQRFDSVKSLAPKVLNTTGQLCADGNAFGEMAAVYWSYNIALYLQARPISSGRLCSLDFNHMVAKPLDAIETCGELFGLYARQGLDRRSEIDKLFGVYSKNSNFKYSPRQRENDIQRILEANPEHLKAAETLARELLADRYPVHGLPGNLLDRTG